MRLLQLLLILVTCWLTSCVSSPLPLAGGQVQRDRACDWQHLELHLVLDQEHEHLRGTARLHVRGLGAATRSVTLDLGRMRLSGAIQDSAGRELELLSSQGSLRQVQLASTLARGEQEVLQVRFDGTAGPGLSFEATPAGDWVRLTEGAFFPHVQGRGHFPTADVTLFANGESAVVGPGQRLPSPAPAVGPRPFHFRMAQPSDPKQLNMLVGPLQTVELSGQDQGWCSASEREASKLWAQAWMRARATDPQPGPAARVAFLPQDFAPQGWQGGWVAIPMPSQASISEARTICRRLVIERNLTRDMLPDNVQARALLQALVVQAQMNEGLLAPQKSPSRMLHGLQAMQEQLGAAGFENLRTDFLELYQGQPMGVWEWARFAGRREGLSANSLFETLTGR